MEGYARVIAARRIRTVTYSGGFLLITAIAWLTAEIDLARLFANFGSFGGYFDRILKLEDGARVWTDPAEWFWGWKRWGPLLLDTLLIAYVGTIIGALAGFVLCFVASANLVRTAWMRWSARRILEFARTVPELVFALIFVIAFGLGPIPGVLALALHTMGALGKQFYELVENIDMKPVDGVSSTGSGWIAIVRFAALPQVLSGFVSYGLVRFEINVRSATVMGFVGAGGIGQDLLEAIRKFYYADVSALLVVIITTVVAIDLVSERLRHRLLSMEMAR
jgi:phosphonate transport system permease protein